jgi:Spy/CpxP family protein refolding chaperone
MNLHLNLKQILAVTAVGISVGAAAFFFCARALPALADDNKSPFVDKDFEVALANHIEKRFFARINATDDQREKISAVVSARMEVTRPLREDLRSGALELTEMMGADTSDATLMEKAHNLRDKRDRLAEERLQTILKVRALLTPDQRKQVCNRIADAITNGLGGQLMKRLQ